MGNYTLEDIRRYINKREKHNLLIIKKILKNIPIIGPNIYSMAMLEQIKVDIFRRELEEIEQGTFEEQQKFIREFTPILTGITTRRKMKIKIKKKWFYELFNCIKFCKKIK